MISDVNILRFIYFLIFIFFMFVHLSIIFWLILNIKRKEFFLGYPCSLPLYKKDLFLKELAFF